MKTDRQLKEIYDKYIDIPIYRVVPERMLRDILKYGINPKKDPYERIKLEIKKLAKIINYLERKGIIIRLQWGRPVHASYAMAVTLNDLKIPVVDFAPTIEDVEYYLKLKGGATISNIKRLTNRIIEEKPNLNNHQWKLINELNKWAKEKVCNNIVISIIGNSKTLETSRFQLIRRGKGGRKKYKDPKYLSSPFGSFEHFKKIIKKQGLKKYIHRLKNKKFYLRVKDKIPAKNIRRLR